MDSIIEVQRQTHEEVERFQLALSDILARPNAGHRHNLVNQHKAKDLLSRVVDRTVDLNNLYLDPESERHKEIEILTEKVIPGKQDDLTEFYSRLSRIRTYYTRYPNAAVGGIEEEVAAIVGDEEEAYDDEDDPVARLFTGEESFGRYLDLNTHHTLYCNLKYLTKRLGYLQYLDTLIATKDAPIGHELSKDCKSTKEYEAYLLSLKSYLVSFLDRTQPLDDNDKKLKKMEDEFDQLWEAGKIDDGNGAAETKTNGTPAPAGEGIWCAACHKFYSKQTVYDAHLQSKKHIKAAERLNGESSASVPNGNGTSQPQSRRRVLALLTYQTTALLRSLNSVLMDTKSNVERRFALTSRERELELEEEPVEVAPPAEDGQQEEEEEERIYNPLKLPMGWDGKPIPYWLYKLHGLGVEYQCEICSDQTYMGRKNFERHFQESKHTFGLKALGLPNTKHFHEITKIADALALADKLKQEGRLEIMQTETMEEMEDEDGNVYSRKTYEDLKKQGII
ncbi:RNA splicing factor PRP9 [Calocera cornea HHB12733]|uniref:RNA splicing factor PRP9 n=1 Tax=Calocera cornea HHB12733 TaxID=1353952 RepID=A0A165K8D2_9BASI|nr:RNA splicing factor PRP9 [Calocera cornea HHB12733]